MRIREFLKKIPPSFTISSPIEDPKNFTQELKKLFEVMHIVGTERLELDAYNLKGISRLGLISGRRVEMRMHHRRVGTF